MFSACPLHCWHFHFALYKNGLRELDLGALFLNTFIGYVVVI